MTQYYIDENDMFVLKIPVRELWDKMHSGVHWYNFLKTIQIHVRQMIQENWNE